MKKKNVSKIAATLAAVGLTAILTGCGQAGTGTITAPNNNLLYGLGGCVVNLIPNGATSPQVNTLTFNGTGVTNIDNAQIVAGAVPLVDNIAYINTSKYNQGGVIAGTVTVAAGAALTAASIKSQNAAAGNQIYINQTGLIAGNNMNGETVNITGSFTFGAQQLSSITGYLAAAYPNILANSAGVNIPSMLPSQYCINGMAMDIGYNSSSGIISGGRVYFYVYEPAYSGTAVGYTGALPYGYSPTGTTGSAAGHGIIAYF